MGAISPFTDGHGGGFHFRCPGCGAIHGVSVGAGPGPRWGFSGDLDRPTFTPSIRVRSGHYAKGGGPGDCWCDFKARTGEEPAFSCYVCHSFVTDGRIQFLCDCTHALAGQTVPLPQFSEEEPE